MVHRIGISPESAAKLITAAFKDVGSGNDNKVSTTVTRKKVRSQMNSVGKTAFSTLINHKTEGR